MSNLANRSRAEISQVFNTRLKQRSNFYSHDGLRRLGLFTGPLGSMTHLRETQV